MKINQLGRLTELPKVPKGEDTSVLILVGENQYTVFEAAMINDEDTWFNLHKQSEVGEGYFAEFFPNGFDAVLITFEPKI